MIRITHLPAAAAIVFTLVAATPGAAITPTSTETHRDGDVTYFRIELPMPNDLSESENLFAGFRGRFPTEFSQLKSNPAHLVPTYMDIQKTDEWGPLQTSNAFYGKTTATGQLNLKLIYPQAVGKWGTEDVTVSLDTGDAMTTRSTTEFGNTSIDLSPAQQFARARANSFQVYGNNIPADAGFFNYAHLQTLRDANLTRLHDAQTRQDNTMGINRDNLYETATGARAIQETLQVDRILGNANTTEPRTIDISTIEGVQTKPHPWDEMLKGKSPKHSEIARLIPADQYMLRFNDVSKLQDLGDLVQRWGGSIMKAPEIGSPDSGLLARIQKQICLPSDALSRIIGPTMVNEVAITGSDPYFREGTDISVIFETKNADLFTAAAAPYWNAGSKTANADTATTTVSGTDVEVIRTPDRSISAYRATVDNTVIYSNSPVGMQRVLETHANPESSLAKSQDFQYMRSVWPQDDAEEDGFLFLSDAFVRRLVGPESKIKEKRRVEGYGSMRMLLNAAMLHGYNHGPGKTPTLEDMLEANLLQESDIAISDGKLRWEPSTASVSNTLYGTPQFMTPLAELSIDKISKTESEEYARFRDRYQQYWRQFFDPIGIRIKLDQTIKLDAYIMPLIDETAYQTLRDLTGDKPAKIDLAKVTTGTLLRWQIRLDPESSRVNDMRQMAGGIMGRESALMDWIGEWATVWLEDSEVSSQLFGEYIAPAVGEEAAAPSRQLGFFEVPVAAGVHVKNRLSMASFLVALQGLAKSAAPDLVQFIPQDPYKGTTLVKVAPTPGNQLMRQMSGDSATTTPDIALFYGNIGDGWYISTKESVMKGLIDSLNSTPTMSRVIDYNGLFIASPANAKKVRPVIEKATAAYVRKIERDKLQQAWLMYRCGLVQSDDKFTSVAEKWFGGPITLPTGGNITYDPTLDQTISSVYGPLYSMKPADEANAPNPMLNLFDTIAHLRAWLRFTEDGLATTMEIEQTQP